MDANVHIPVLLEETLEGLRPALTRPSATMVDGTLGGAGHTSAVLARFQSTRVLACDWDEGALASARLRLENHVKSGRLDFFHGNFARIAEKNTVLPPAFAPPWDAILLDLGYSSNQLENPAYGMSFREEAPLDMRLARPAQGATAWELLRESAEGELADILYAYGEIHGSRRLARKIKEAMRSGEIADSTKSLASFLERIGEGGAGRKKADAIHPATLVFQALRIAVNDELRNLDHFLEDAILRLKAGGRIAVITFHSLEDRVVKRWGRRNGASLSAVTRKPVTANPTEARSNPRSRSAKLRLYERNGV